MLYDFKCKNCNENKQIEIPVDELSKVVVKCDKCGNVMIRNWKAGITIADNDKASNIEEMSWVKTRLRNLPSGKSQTLY